MGKRMGLVGRNYPVRADRLKRSVTSEANWKTRQSAIRLHKKLKEKENEGFEVAHKFSKRLDGFYFGNFNMGLA